MADHRLEVYIETLTGTAFELQVSPLETIMSIKAKIQHLEGIPISQQHLIWKAEELDNGCCLEDYRIADGATLKLVLGMRGGPVNTRTYTAEHRRPSLSTMTELLENGGVGEELNDGRPLTVVVFHDGEQVHWYTIIDESECSSSTHSRSESTTSSVLDLQSEPPSGEQMHENHTMRQKMSALQKRFQALGLKRSKKKKNRSTTPSTSTSQSESQTPFLPPLASSSSVMAADKARLVSRGMMHLRHHISRRDSVEKLPSITSANVLETSRTPRLPPARPPFHLPPSSCGHSTCSSPGQDNNLLPPPAAFSPSYSRTRVLPDILPRTSKESGEAGSFNLRDSCRFSSQAGTPSTASKRLPDLELWLRNRPKTTPSKWSGVYRPFESLLTHKELTTTKSVHNVGVPNNSTPYGRKSRLGGTDPFWSSLRKTTPSPPSGMGLGSMVAAGIRGLRSSRKKKDSKTDPVVETSSSTAQHPSEGSGSRPSSTTKLPPIQVKKKKGKRCTWCNKKTGLASTYICRCLKSFCATHRYPETHRCNYDFKTEGRRILEKSNPVIAAPKLPKI